MILKESSDMLARRELVHEEPHRTISGRVFKVIESLWLHRGIHMYQTDNDIFVNAGVTRV